MSYNWVKTDVANCDKITLSYHHRNKCSSGRRLRGQPRARPLINSCIRLLYKYGDNCLHVSVFRLLKRFFDYRSLNKISALLLSRVLLSFEFLGVLSMTIWKHSVHTLLVQ